MLHDRPGLRARVFVSSVAPRVERRDPRAHATRTAPIDILRFVASRPANEPIRGADIPGLEAAGGSACIEWLAHCGLIEASVTAADCIVEGITAAGRALLAKAEAARALADGSAVTGGRLGAIHG